MDNETLLSSLKQQLKKDGKLRLRLKIVPKSSTTEFVGMLGEDVVKIRIAAVPAKNKANTELVRFLSNVFGVPKSACTIVSGPTSPLKIVDILK